MIQAIRSAVSMVLLGWALIPAAASACVLDNTSSLSANGNPAQKNLSPPRGHQVFYAPFVFPLVYGSNQTITFRENFADLRKSLSPRALAQPFLWRWGDGSYSIARAPHHVYRHVGTYEILVYPASPLTIDGPWSPFDRVQIQIVPPGEVWKDNLGQGALAVFGMVVTWGGRLVLGLITLALAWGFFHEWRGSRTTRRGAASGHSATL